jgi:hypothetical protein
VGVGRGIARGHIHAVRNRVMDFDGPVFHGHCGPGDLSFFGAPAARRIARENNHGGAVLPQVR